MTPRRHKNLIFDTMTPNSGHMFVNVLLTSCHLAKNPLIVKKLTAMERLLSVWRHRWRGYCQFDVTLPRMG